MLAKILGCQRIVEMPTGMHNNNGGSGSGSGKTAPVERKYEHLQMAINGRAGKNNFGRISKKKESEGRTESMKIDQLSVNAVFV